MGANLQRRVASLNEKMPDIQKTLDVVRFLAMRKVRFPPIFGQPRLRKEAVAQILVIMLYGWLC